MTTDALIDIKGVTHAYETAAGPLPVLDNLNVSVNEGGFVAVVGPSGCGKSTLTRLVAGLMKPDTGEVWLHGERVKSPRSTVGMAFQNPVLLEWRSILKNVMLPLEIVPTKLSNTEKKETAPARFFHWSACKALKTNARPNCPEECASVRRCAVRLCISPKRSSLTSPLEHWTLSPAKTFGKRCTR
jgi:ABC-type sugar transport system ATPase subunit